MVQQEVSGADAPRFSPLLLKQRLTRSTVEPVPGGAGEAVAVAADRLSKERRLACFVGRLIIRTGAVHEFGNDLITRFSGLGVRVREYHGVGLRYVSGRQSGLIAARDNRFASDGTCVHNALLNHVRTLPGFSTRTARRSLEFQAQDVIILPHSPVGNRQRWVVALRLGQKAFEPQDRRVVDTERAWFDQLLVDPNPDPDPQRPHLLEFASLSFPLRGTPPDIETLQAIASQLQPPKMSLGYLGHHNTKFNGSVVQQPQAG